MGSSAKTFVFGQGLPNITTTSPLASLDRFATEQSANLILYSLASPAAWHRLSLGTLPEM